VIDSIHHEILAEKAATLGRAGKKLAAKLALLRQAAADADRASLVQDAADAAHNYFIQRELCGLRSHQGAIDDLDIPKEVMARVGIK
jgi:hypothetical protein